MRGLPQMPIKLRLFLGTWLLAAVAAGAVLYYQQPSGPLKWALWAIAVPPGYALVNGLAELAVHGYFKLPGIRQTTDMLDRRSTGRNFSGLRFLWLLANVLLALALCLTFAVVLSA